MNKIQKEKFLYQATAHLKEVIASLRDSFFDVQKKNVAIRKELPKANEDNKIVQQKLLEHGVSRENELEALIPSPYFTHCAVDFGGGTDSMYFGTFSYTDKDIFSWVTAASSLRFEKPGSVSYERPDGTRRKGILKQKDQYMITDGKIVFLATESIEQDRVLVYQEYFSQQKTDFVLPEIVAQMEKAQDTVIRANHRGPLVISGPAGSGKTTLALHRVAYLAQSPDVSHKFPPHSIIVFVQDEGTKEYFSHLLPQLGIKGVKITTFAQWAFDVLGLEHISYTHRYGAHEEEQDRNEFYKHHILKQKPKVEWQDNVFAVLKQVYGNLSKGLVELFESQAQDRVLDRMDVAILMNIFKAHVGKLTMKQEYYEIKKNQEGIKKFGRFPVTYSLIIFDEFQNYLPEQISLAKSTLDEENHAVMYVGDMNQQTQYGTIQAWSDIRENIPEDRQVVLHKVYRNTKQIVQYVSGLGYDVEVDSKLRDGKPVQERVCDTLEEEKEWVSSILGGRTGTVGILAKDKSYIGAYSDLHNPHEGIFVMTMAEAQGVEFDVVCVVGIDDTFFGISYEEDMKSYGEQRRRIMKDLLYVALTRAMNELYIAGRQRLSEIFQI